MNAERLLELYDNISEAPDAVERLRRFVLDLAVRGKLVEQDVADEAVKLTPKTRLASPKMPVPSGWVASTIGQVLDFQYGKGKKKSERLEQGPVPVFGSNGVVGFSDEPLTENDAIIVGRKGSAGALNLCIGPSWTTDVAYFVEAPAGFQLRYLLLALKALDLDTLGKGVKPGLSRADAYPLEIHIPPLAEQHRIVAKVDGLMTLCDRLEEARKEREATRDRLTTVSLARLTAPETTQALSGKVETGFPSDDAQTDDSDFPAHAAFALNALPALTTRPHQIKSLRQTILNLAVRGKLVEQDPADERIDKNKLRPDSEAERYDRRSFDERAAIFALPDGWSMQPLSRVAERIVDCPHTTPKWTGSGVLCIKTNQVRAGVLDLTSPNFVSEETYNTRIERLTPLPDDILYIREGGILGVGCRIPRDVKLCMGQRLMLIRANASIAPVFLELCLNSPWIADFAAEKTTGGAAPRVNMALVRGYPIPIPPLAEQHRIVAKVDELMALCDQLEAALTKTDTTRTRLLEALLHEALEPTSSNNGAVE